MDFVDRVLSALMAFGWLRKIFLKIAAADRGLGVLEKEFSKGQKVLDVGSGLGLEAQSFSQNGLKVVALEMDRGLSVLPKKFFGINSVNASAALLPFKSNSFDKVFLASVLHHIPAGQQKNCLKEFARVLKPNGKLVIVEPKPESGFDGFFDRHILGYGFYGFFDFKKEKNIELLEHGSRQMLIAKKSQVLGIGLYKAGL